MQFPVAEKTAKHLLAGGKPGVEVITTSPLRQAEIRLSSFLLSHHNLITDCSRIRDAEWRLEEARLFSQIIIEREKLRSLSQEEPVLVLIPA